MQEYYWLSTSLKASPLLDTAGCSGKDYGQDAQDGRWREEVWGESELQNVTDMADISM